MEQDDSAKSASISGDLGPGADVNAARGASSSYMSGLRLKPPQEKGRGVWIWRNLSGKAAAGRAGVAAAMEMVK